MLMETLALITGDLFRLSKSHKGVDDHHHEIVLDRDDDAPRAEQILKAHQVAMVVPHMGHLAVNIDPAKAIDIETLPGLSLRPANYQ